MSEALYDYTAEIAVLGAVVINNGLLDDLAGVLEAEHFGRPHHRDVFGAMLRVHARNQPVDPLTVVAELEKTGLEDATKAFVWTLGNGVPRSTNISTYAQIVRDKSLLRSLRDEARRVLAEADAAQVSGQALLEQAEQALYRLTQSAVKTDWVSGEVLAGELYPVLEDIESHRKGISGVPTGFTDLDLMTRGFQRGDLVLLGARPSSGKTAIGLQMALHAAAHGSVAFFTVEMGRQSIGLRAVTGLAQVDGFRLMSGYLSDVEMRRVGEALSTMASRAIYFDESPHMSPLQVRAKLRRLTARTGRIALVVIDYLQLMAPLPEDRRENKTNQVAGISRALKLLAREFATPFLVLAQLNRGLERSADKRPTLADLRDSGALEQDADVVLLMHRPEMYEPNRPELEGQAQLIVGKHRNGPTGTVDLFFRKAQMRFESVAR